MYSNSKKQSKPFLSFLTADKLQMPSNITKDIMLKCQKILTIKISLQLQHALLSVIQLYASALDQAMKPIVESEELF